LLALLLQGIPETVAVVTLAFVIARIPLRWCKIIMIGTILACISYVVRLFPTPFGIHTFLLITLLFIALTSLGKGDFSLCLLASLLSSLALVIFEFACLSLLMPIFGITPKTAFSNLGITIAISEPQVLLVFSTAYLINKLYKKKRVIE
jgi:hypothetical protein